MGREHMTIVVVGHVDHGKSTVIGRLFADTGSLPKGKLDEVRARCERNARPFEYAFLLDALKDEQAQGITIDSARSFFKTRKRHYLIFDAPGHIEFLKNMVTGAAQAEAALLVIDAHEGIRENSRRHGYLLSMLGVRQVAIVVNKMDLVNYKKEAFEDIKRTYNDFLDNLGVRPVAFIPACAREGENISRRSTHMDWYKGPTVLEQLDLFTPSHSLVSDPFRFPVQDIYKFTEEGDQRRIFAGTVQSGRISVGEEVVCLPSEKRARITTVEEFNVPRQESACAGKAVGFTVEPQVYVKPGELMCKAGEEKPNVSDRFRANIFWMGKDPLVKSKAYKLKVASARVSCRIEEIVNVIDALELSELGKKEQVNIYDVAEVIIKTSDPVAFDRASSIEPTGRFVVIDDYEISAGGVILEPLSADIPVEGPGAAGKQAVIHIVGPRGAEMADIAREVGSILSKKGNKDFYMKYTEGDHHG